MPQGTFATPGNTPSRGLGNHSGGAFDQSIMQDLIDGDSMLGPITKLTGAADAINPHVAGNYIVSTAGIDAMTLPLPTATVDDGVSITIISDTANAHTVTLPSANFLVGTVAPQTVATFVAQRGAGIYLRAWQGSWQVLGVAGKAGVSVTFA